MEFRYPDELLVSFPGGNWCDMMSWIFFVEKTTFRNLLHGSVAPSTLQVVNKKYTKHIYNTKVTSHYKYHLMWFVYIVWLIDAHNDLYHIPDTCKQKALP